MTKIVSINGFEKTEAGASKSAINLLEEILEETKQGKYIAMAIFLVDKKNEIYSRVSEHDVGKHTLVAACEYLKYDLINNG